MARTIGTVSLADLIERGTLKPQEKLVLRRRSKPAIEAQLDKNGSIKVAGGVYATPSAAACNALGVSSVDGWLRWRVPRLENRTLAEVRSDG